MQWMGGVCKRHKPWPGIERRFVADAWNKGSRERVQRKRREQARRERRTGTGTSHGPDGHTKWRATDTALGSGPSLVDENTAIEDGF